jgi:23S rRNA pseudouridine955/2504/2580 synthase
MRKIIFEDAKPIQLSVWLKARFPALPDWALKTALKNKDIRINGKRTGEDATLSRGDEVTVYVDDARLDGPPLDIAWFSKNVLVAVKLPGINSKAGGETDMQGLVSAWLEKQGEPTETHACHRLDNQTGGLMIFARNEEALAAIRNMMDAGKIEKTYTCIVKGMPSPARATLKSFLKKDSEKAIVTVHSKPIPGARTAITEYAVMDTKGRLSLLEVKLHTGRTHQIRAQMAHIGCPVLGDDKYGDRETNKQYKARRQKLWASGLAFGFSPDECPELSEIAGKTLSSPAPFLYELKRISY